MTEHIFPDRAFRRRISLVIVISPAVLISSLLALPAGADRPCPPQLGASDGNALVGGAQACPTPEAGPSETPAYDDPMKSCQSLGARRIVNVSSASALQQAVTNAACGDTIQLAPGTYGSDIMISKECQANVPLAILGAANFESSVSGTFRIEGARIIVAGINFSGPNANARLSGTNNKLIANKFTDWRNVAVKPLTGKQGEIAYNEFSNPHPWLASEAGSYPLRIGIRTGEKDPSSFHFNAWVHHNYFHDLPAKPDPSSYHSGQSDAIEVCETGRASTASMLTGWYIESNLVERHKQGHGIIDLKCGGNTVRYNSVLDSPGGRIDSRNGSYNVLESNWLENSGGTSIHGGYNKIIGNRVRGGSITVMAGESEWNIAGEGYARAYHTLVAGNDASALYVGKAYNSSSLLPALETVVEGHVGTQPVLGAEDSTIIKSATNVAFSAPSKLSPGDVGPAALRAAPSAYLACRAP